MPPRSVKPWSVVRGPWSVGRNPCAVSSVGGGCVPRKVPLSSALSDLGSSTQFKVYNPIFKYALRIRIACRPTSGCTVQLRSLSGRWMPINLVTGTAYLLTIPSPNPGRKAPQTDAWEQPAAVRAYD